MRLPVAGVLALLCAAAASGPPASAGAGARVAAADAPVVSGFVLRPLTVRPGTRATFRFVTSREGAGSIALARITRTGRTVPAGRLRFAVDAGDGRKVFDGRVAGRRLAAGRYRATVTVTNAGSGVSAPRRLTFRIAA